MKKSLITLILAFFIQGCSEPTPSIPEPDPSAISYLKAENTLDYEAVYDQLSKEDQGYISKADYVELKFPSDSFFGDMREETTSLTKVFASQTTYTVEEKIINGSTANLVVSISAPDYSQFLGEIFTQSLSQVFSGEEAPDSNELLEGLADKQDVPRKIIKQELELILEEGQWRVFENVKAAYEEAQIEKKIDELLEKASDFEKKQKFTESINNYKEVLEIDESNIEAKQGINKIEDKIEEAEFKQAYVENIEIFEFEAKRIDTYLDENVPAVRFSLKNNGDRSLDKVKVTVYFYDNNNQPIYEKTYTPVLVSEYSFLSDDGPLKPNYIWRGEANNYYTIEQLGPEWSGRAKAIISDIEFSE